MTTVQRELIYVIPWQIDFRSRVKDRIVTSVVLDYNQSPVKYRLKVRIGCKSNDYIHVIRFIANKVSMDSIRVVGIIIRDSIRKRFRIVSHDAVCNLSLVDASAGEIAEWDPLSVCSDILGDFFREIVRRIERRDCIKHPFLNTLYGRVFSKRDGHFDFCLTRRLDDFTSGINDDLVLLNIKAHVVRNSAGDLEGNSTL